MSNSFINSVSYIALQDYLKENRDLINSKYNFLYRFKKNMNRFDYFDNQLLNLDYSLLEKCGINNWNVEKVNDYYYFSIDYDYHYDINLSCFGYRIYQAAFNYNTNECFFSNMLIFPELQSTKLYFIENFEGYLQNVVECYYFTKKQEGCFEERKSYFHLLLFDENTDFIEKDGSTYQFGKEKKYNF